MGLRTRPTLAIPDKAVDAIRTATPIRHVIIIVGENRSFDHLFATYVPKNREEKVRNLLSEGIVNADGSPDKNFAWAHQFQIVAPPNGDKYFISADRQQKASITCFRRRISPVFKIRLRLPFLLSQAATPAHASRSVLVWHRRHGSAQFSRYGYAHLECQHTSPRSFSDDRTDDAYDAYTGDTIHQFFQMYQQMDCAIDAEHNPTGCLHDLQSAITTTYSTPPGGTPYDTGQTMLSSTCRMATRPSLSASPNQFTMSDNCHHGWYRAGQRAARLCGSGVLQ